MPGNKDNDSCDSWVVEFIARPSFAVPLLQSNCNSETSEVILDDLSMPSYELLPCTTHGKRKVQYSLDIHVKCKYPISHYVTTHCLSKSYASYLC